MAKETEFGAGTSSLQLHTEHQGLIPGPAKAEFGRLSWERHNWLTSPREVGGTRQGGSQHATATPGASESQARLELMRLGEGGRMRSILTNKIDWNRQPNWDRKIR